MKIYPIIVNGNKRYRLDYVVSGKRIRKVFPSKKAAEEEQEQLKSQKAKTGEAWISLPQAIKDEIVTVYQQARDAGVSLSELWAHWKGTKRTFETVTIGHAIKKHLESKAQNGRREIYLTNLRVFLNMFAKGKESQNLPGVANRQNIELWLENFQNGNYKTTALNRLSSFLTWCVQRDWLIENPCDRIERPTIQPVPPTILTNEQIKSALEFTQKEHPNFIAWLSLGVFSGLRPSEIDRLTWANVDLVNKTVEVSAMNKTRSRRIVPLLDNAVEWLKVAKGDIAHRFSTRRDWIRSVRNHLGMNAWPADILRHTAASHLTHHFKSAEQAALILGNSAGMLHRHYRNLISDVDNKAWLEMKP